MVSDNNDMCGSCTNEAVVSTQSTGERRKERNISDSVVLIELLGAMMMIKSSVFLFITFSFLITGGCGLGLLSYVNQYFNLYGQSLLNVLASTLDYDPNSQLFFSVGQTAGSLTSNVITNEFCSGFLTIKNASADNNIIEIGVNSTLNFVVYEGVISGPNKMVYIVGKATGVVNTGSTVLIPANLDTSANSILFTSYNLVTSELKNIQIGTGGDSAGYAIGMHYATGKIFVSGYTSGGLISVNSTLLPGFFLGGIDCFLTIIDSTTGSTQTIQWGTGLEEEVYSLTVDQERGKVYLIGYSYGCFAGNPCLPGVTNGFFASFFINGTLDAIKQFYGPTDSYTAGSPQLFPFVAPNPLPIFSPQVPDGIVYDTAKDLIYFSGYLNLGDYGFQGFVISLYPNFTLNNYWVIPAINGSIIYYAINYYWDPTAKTTEISF
eukprot:TRINITY_DN6820_c0_g2_i1.p1 TRINITY_DN6820_c0_g2~~TRINITY_DN6820_c0_g2_i1.p1  ORF type:complete len:435 (-),score=63.57 TRINITY_DN6820_c0_g2_i1:137-1441(-)